MRILPLIVIAACALRAEGQEQTPKDCSFFPGMPAYEITSSEDREFDSRKIFSGAAFTPVEGRLCYREYGLREGAKQASSLQIIRNYANAMKAAGGTVFQQGLCEGEACGDLDGTAFLTGRMSKKGQEVWLEVSPADEGAWYRLTAVAKQAMRQDITAGEMLEALNAKGRVALYINFDTGKHAIKAESRPVIEQVVALLRENPALKLSVEGHTDDTGEAEGNKRLSTARAKAVMAALVEAGVAAERLSSAGFGREKPLADNKTEEGRAKNRRVELVKK